MDTIDNKSTIEPIPEFLTKANRMAEIRFDAYVEMYDSGYRTLTNGGIFTSEKRDKKPQWFRSHVELTLDSIKFADPYDIGMAIKRQFYELEAAIKKYEENF